MVSIIFYCNSTQRTAPQVNINLSLLDTAVVGIETIFGTATHHNTDAVE